MKLALLQRSFQAHVLRGDPAIEGEIAADAGISAARRLAVYTEAYSARLTEVLGESFPAVQAALGTALFARLVGDFARQHPSRVRSARAYGEELPQWLASRLEGPRAQGIADLARFEWAMAGAFDAADQMALGPQRLVSVEAAQWPSLQFAFSPSLRRLSVSSNCVAWWTFACAGQPRPRRWRSTCTQQWLVWRQELAVFYRRLSRAETQALDAALTGCTFGQLCQQLPIQSGARGATDVAAMRAATLLHGWFSAGLVVGVSARGKRRSPRRPR
jgi:hypothetical protein